MKRTFKNPKNQETITTELSAIKAQAILTQEYIKNKGEFLGNILGAYGRMTPGQEYYFYKMASELSGENKSSVKSYQTNVGNSFEGIFKLFNSAKTKEIDGEVLLNPKIRLIYNNKKVVLSLAPETGSNKGHIYVKIENDYAGKVSPQGIFSKSHTAPNDIEDFLKKFGESPLKLIQEYGRISHRCSCCGRKLTRKESIERMMGEICYSRFF